MSVIEGFRYCSPGAWRGREPINGQLNDHLLTWIPELLEPSQSQTPLTHTHTQKHTHTMFRTAGEEEEEGGCPLHLTLSARPRVWGFFQRELELTYTLSRSLSHTLSFPRSRSLSLYLSFFFSLYLFFSPLLSFSHSITLALSPFLSLSQPLSLLPLYLPPYLRATCVCMPLLLGQFRGRGGRRGK